MKVIKHSQMPPKLPLFPTITAALALSQWNAPDWVWGAVGVLFLFLWISAIVSVVQEDQHEVLFKDEEDK